MNRLKPVERSKFKRVNFYLSEEQRLQLRRHAHAIGTRSMSEAVRDLIRRNEMARDDGK